MCCWWHSPDPMWYTLPMKQPTLAQSEYWRSITALTPTDKATIRQRYHAQPKHLRPTYGTLAKEYDVSMYVIWKVLNTTT